MRATTRPGGVPTRPSPRPFRVRTVTEYVRFRDLMANGRKPNVTLDEEYNGWHPDPFGRFDERYIVYGEPSRLVRHEGVEQTDRQPPFEMPAVPAVDHRVNSTLAPIDDRPDPVPVASSRFRVRRSRQRAIGVVVILLVLCALIASGLVSRPHGHPATPTSAGGQLPRAQVTANTSIPSRRTPRSPPRRAVPSTATPGHGPSVHTAPKPSELSRTAMTEWANRLRSDLNNVDEVAYTYGPGPLEQTACQRAWNDAANVPTPTLRSDSSAAAKVASHDIMTFANECAHTQDCLNDRGTCGHTKFGDAYRRSVQDLDALRTDLTRN
jgi:hypothetical protein